MFFTLVILFITAYATVHTFHKRVNIAIHDTKSALNATNLDTSFGTRIAAFKALPYLIEKKNLLFGVGIGDKPTFVKEKLQKNFPYKILAFNKYGYLHNSHLEIFISLGVVGLILYFLIFYFTFTMKIEDKMMQYIAHTIPIYFLFIGLTTDLFYFYHISVLFAAFLGIVVAQSYQEQLERSS
jgi:O-antigen ligase